tara:strand:+ start:41 stop:346 length:306 start_codon:yes stop_codon:yes gene_type:complete
MFAFIAEAQENKFASKRAVTAVEYISSNMDLSEANIEFLKETLYNKYVSNSKKIRGKNLSQDEKKQVYRTAFIETRKKLMTIFSKEQVGKITKLERQSHKN